MASKDAILTLLMKTKRNKKKFPFLVIELDITEDTSGHTNDRCLLLSNIID